MEPITHSSYFSDCRRCSYDFYTNVLNLSLIKQTVNYDDTKHITYISQMTERNMIWYLLSFNWPNQYRGRIGSGQVGHLAFRIPKDTCHIGK